MITGTLKNQTDAIWNTFWSGGIATITDVPALPVCPISK